MDSIEKLLKTGRPAKPPEHNFQIFAGSEPKLVDVKQLERDAKEYQTSKESLVMSDDNKPIFIDPKKYPSPHMIIYEYEIKGSHTTEELIAKKAAALGKGMVVRFICSSADYPFISKAVGEDYTLKRGSAVADFLKNFAAEEENGGTTFDPCMEISKLPDDVKDKLTQEIIKIIEKREEERKLE